MPINLRWHDRWKTNQAKQIDSPICTQIWGPVLNLKSDLRDHSCINLFNFIWYDWHLLTPGDIGAFRPPSTACRGDSHSDIWPALSRFNWSGEPFRSLSESMMGRSSENRVRKHEQGTGYICLLNLGMLGMEQGFWIGCCLSSNASGHGNIPLKPWATRTNKL